MTVESNYVIAIATLSDWLKRLAHVFQLGSLSTRVFETRTATGREHSMCQGSGFSHIFILIIHNREKVLSIVNVMVLRRDIRENSSLPLAVRVSK